MIGLEEAHGCGEGKGGTRTVWLAFGLKLHRFAAHAAGPARPVLALILPHCRASIGVQAYTSSRTSKYKRAQLHFFKNEELWADMPTLLQERGSVGGRAYTSLRTRKCTVGNALRAGATGPRSFKHTHTGGRSD